MFDTSKVLEATSTIADGNMSFTFGNDAAVVKNRTQFLATHELSHEITHERVICMACTNGARIQVVDATSTGTGAKCQAEMLEAEILVTRERGLALMVLTADCIPASFYDPVQQVIALAHLNRKTIAHDLAQKTVGFLREQFGTDPTDLLVHFGPHIHATSYIYPLPLTDPTPPQLTRFITEQDGNAYIDITTAHRQQLIDSDIPPENISVSPVDVGISPEHFSHYRTQHDPSHPAGRLATILVLR